MRTRTETPRARRAIARALLLLVAASVASPARAQYPYVVKDINPGTASSSPTSIQDWNGQAAFIAQSAAEGREWWVSDGTESGTQILLDIGPGSSSGVSDSYSVEWNGYRYFRANDGVHGSELWRTDGTGAGTSLFFDFEPGAGSSGPTPTIVGGRMYVAASTAALGRELWVSDGTAAGTQLLLDLNPGPASGLPPFGGSGRVMSVFGKGLFPGNDGVHGIEPWITDGTPGGTFLLVDVNPGSAPSISSLSIEVSVFGSVALFGAYNTSVGTEPWSTDGTPAGTSLVRDINPGTSGSFSFFAPRARLATGILFAASTAATGEEPWISDGTAAGTFLLRDVDPGPSSSLPVIVDLGTGTAVFGAESPATGYEPWITDGTPGGTFVAEIWPGAGSGSYYTNQLFYESGGRAYFPAISPATDLELGTSDGTVVGTRVVRDLLPGTTDGFGGLFPVDGFLLYKQAVGGPFLLAYSDGFAATTALVPLDPELPMSSMFEVVRIGDRLFFKASHASVGSELFALDVDGDGDGTIEYFDDLNFEPDCLCSAAVAPCGNADPAAGCANSTGVGARLDGAGTTRLAANDLVLSISGLPAFAKGFLFMSAKAAPSVPFGDGARCVGGSIASFAARVADASGTAGYGPGVAPRATTPSSSPLFRFTAGATRRFQFWYRDAAGPCATGSNVSSSATVVFTP